MGNCCAAQGAGPKSEINNLNKQKTRRQSNWAATGTVALRDSKLKALPSAVLELGPAARVIDATNNQLTYLPDQISQFSNLHRFVLASNQLNSLPPCLAQLVSLKVLILDANQLISLPSDIGQLVRLERLSVKNNALTALPSTISQLQKLSLLDVSSNNLAELTHAVAVCLQLEELHASNNKLLALPASLGQLQRLKMLNLNENQISSVPTEVLTGCHALHTLLLHANPITAQEFEATDGFYDFEQRRRTKYSKNIATGVSVGSGLEEGIDRQLK